MQAPHKFLMVVDPEEPKSPALDRATWLAQTTHAGIDLLVCLNAPQRNRFAEQLERLVDTLTDRGISVTTEISAERPLDEVVVRKAIESGCSMVIKDTHYQSALKRTIFSSTDWNLIRDCPVPLMLVKDRVLTASPRVLAAVDPMHENDESGTLDRRILSLAKSLCLQTGGRLHVVNAFDPAPLGAAGVAEGAGFGFATVPVDLVEAEQQRYREAFEALLADEGLQDAQPHFMVGSAATSLVACAREIPADFVVMGAVSRSVLMSLFIGHTAERVLDRLPCDLIVVKASGSEKVEKQTS